MSKNSKFGLLNILLTEQSGDEIGNTIYDSEFFEMYFNGNCEDTAEFLIKQFEKSKVSWDRMIEVTEGMDCASTLEYELFRHFPDKMEETFKNQMRYDYDPEKEEFWIDRSDFFTFLEGDGATFWTDLILDPDSQHIEGYIDDWLIEEVVNDFLTEPILFDIYDRLVDKGGMKNKTDILELGGGALLMLLNKDENEEVMDQLKNLARWASQNATEDAYTEAFFKRLKDYFQTDKIVYDQTSRGENILKVSDQGFIYNLIQDGIKMNSKYSDYALLDEVTSFATLLEQGIEIGFLDKMDLPDMIYPSSDQYRQNFLNVYTDYGFDL
jgi:hypothetical protein